MTAPRHSSPVAPDPAGPSRDLDPDAARRMRLALAFGKLGCAAGTLFAGFYLAIGHFWGAVTVLICTGCFALALTLTRRRQISLAGNLYALVLTGGFTALTAIEGGLHGHAIAWLACVPLCACLFASPRAGWVWSAVCAAIVGVFAILACVGFKVPALYPPAWEAAISAAGYLALTGFMAALGVVFETSRRSAFNQLQTTLVAFRENNLALAGSVQNLKKSEGRFRILFENSALGVALVNLRGEVELGSRRLSDLLGFDPAERINLASLVTEVQRDAFLALLARQETDAALRSPGILTPAYEQEFTLDLPGNECRLFRFSVNWIGETRQVCALLDDITEQRVMERSVVQHEKSALLDSLVGGIAHELNNKLTPVVGFSEILLHGAKSGRAHRELVNPARFVHESSVEAGAILAQLLQLSRPVLTELRDCDLRQVVEDACTVLPFRLRETGVQLALELAPQEVTVTADPSQLKQVVLNLALNALDALEKGPGPRRLTIRVHPDAGAGVVEVADTGPGMDAELRTRIFEPFFTTKKGRQAKGLGLSVCMNIVRRHGGEIRVESEPGTGACFRVELPLPATAPPSNAEREAQAAALSGADAPIPDLTLRGGLRALVVDDEKAIAEMVTEAIRLNLDCEVERFETGEAAIARLQQHGDFDLIVSDVRLPGMSGFEILDWLREHRRELVPRVVMITGDAGSPERNLQLARLGVPVLLKPFALSNLLERCRDALEGDPKPVDEADGGARPAGPALETLTVNS